MEENPEIYYDEEGLHILHPEPLPIPDETDADLDPPRRVQPKRNRRPPIRFDPADPPTWPDNEPIIGNCRHKKDGYGCAAASAKHTPRFYNSLCPVWKRL